jgi:hypothetical protein
VVVERAIDLHHDSSLILVDDSNVVMSKFEWSVPRDCRLDAMNELQFSQINRDYHLALLQDRGLIADLIDFIQDVRAKRDRCATLIGFPNQLKNLRSNGGV